MIKHPVGNKSKQSREETRIDDIDVMEKKPSRTSRTLKTK